MSAIHTILADAAKVNVEEYLNAYVENFNSILEAEREGTLIGSVVANSAKDAYDSIKISLLYNDISYLETISGSEGKLKWLSEENFKKLAGSQEIQLTMRDGINEQILSSISKNEFVLSFLHYSDERTEALVKDTVPLIRSGRLMPRPVRQFSYVEHIEPGGRKHWLALSAEPSSKMDSWTIAGRNGSSKDAFVSDIAFDKYYRSDAGDAPITRIAIPYIRGIGLEDYGKILDDEQDLLSSFRAEIKGLVQVSRASPEDIEGIRQDVIRPRIDAIERKFKSISNMSKLKIAGATVVAASVSLFALSTGGLGAAVAAISGGAGGVAVLKEAIDRKQQLDKLKDDPMHVLWRLGRNRR